MSSLGPLADTYNRIGRLGFDPAPIRQRSGNRPPDDDQSLPSRPPEGDLPPAPSPRRPSPAEHKPTGPRTRRERAAARAEAFQLTFRVNQSIKVRGHDHLWIGRCHQDLDRIRLVPPRYV
jgi:hypothetical protein